MQVCSGIVVDGDVEELVGGEMLGLRLEACDLVKLRGQKKSPLYDS